jgi:hypothetical protein
LRTWHVAIVATIAGILLHGCLVLYAFSSDGGEEGESTVPTTVVTAAAQPSATAVPTQPPDRTTCEEIRGTDYRSEAEREFFRANCITPTP